MANLPLASDMSFGWMTVMSNQQETRSAVTMAEELGLDSLWVGDHIAFAVPMLDPFVQLAQAAAHSTKLTFGTSVYLLPLRHPTPVAKQVATLDHLTDGKLIFGVGVGGEFPNEYAACGVPVKERGARMSEGISVLKKLWSGETVNNDSGRFFPFPDVQMLPPPVQKGGPPVWCGGRSAAALRRTGRMADGWISYVVTPEMYKKALDDIAKAAEEEKRQIDNFGTGHLLFFRIDDKYEDAWDHATKHLTTRYAMDFREAAKKYCALGPPADVAARINEFREAGVRHIVLDPTGPHRERETQIERFAKEVRPLL